ncbi:glycoside hydrolase family 3 C-terminal domain-containing protein [Micromonospora sp. SL1-18]|uniref:glycoside hydrolase family 3 C-terminal domain-containing protein n=1 Tax=Micromonospora sp. SL1-18 TaxID=3399128 RepID=UPI003A4DF958
MTRTPRLLALFASLCTLLALTLATPTAAGASTDDDPCPWVGSSASPDERAHQVLARMTLDEKITMLGLTASPDGYQNHFPAIPRLCIPRLILQDGPAGVAGGFRGVTQLPAPIGVAASWDRSVAARYGHIQGSESWGKGIHVAQGPNVNIARVPQNGRTFEAYGEDPHLVSQIAVANIKAIQATGAMADIKHLAANNQESNRLSINEHIDERTLREIYFPAFEAGVRDGDVATAMCAYNQINGDYSCANSNLMSDLFKNEYEFAGFIRSDFGAVHDVAASYNAGMDQAKPQHNAELKAAVLAGTVPMPRIDDAVRRVLREMFRFHLFDHPPTGNPNTVVTSPEHAAVARDLAEQGTVLLKNADATLPLRTEATHSIAVIGADGGDGAYTAGGGSSHVIPPYVVTPYDGIKQRAGGGTQVTYTPGGSQGAPAIPSSALTPPSGSGNGLLGRYYNNENRSGSPVLTRTDPNIDFTWGTGNNAVSPGPGVNATHWSAEWTGTLTAAETGVYTFTLNSDDGSWLYLDGKLVIDNGGNHGPRTRKGTISLVAGQKYQLKVDYFNAIGGEQVHLGWQPPGTGQYAEAEQAAKDADVAIVFANDVESEGTDRPNLSLPNDQDGVIDAVAEANPNTIVVLHTGSAVTMPWLDKVKAVVEGWYAGQEDGNAIAAVLFGDVNPSGKLPLTFPKDESDTPAHTPQQWPGVDGQAYYSEGLHVGYRWYDAQDIEPLFPFGYGLAYTTFALSHLVAAPKQLSAGDHETVSIDVTNTGHRAGAEVVQLYVEMPSGVGEPPKQLKGFQKVSLGPGQKKRVTFRLTPRDLSYWDTRAKGWVMAAGDYKIMVGTSSRDIAASDTIRVKKAIGPRYLTATAPTIAMPGTTATATTAFTNDSAYAVHGAELTLSHPDGWAVKPSSPASFQTVSPGQTVTTTWQVTVPQGTTADDYQLSGTAVYEATQGTTRSSDAVTVTVPYASLAAAYGNVATTSRAAGDASGNFDGANNAYSDEALASVGHAPGAKVTHDGISFTWPDAPSGRPDNTLAAGQTIEVSGSGQRLGFLTASAYGAGSGTGTIYYSDGTTQAFTLGSGDWTGNKAPDGVEIAVTAPDWNPRAGHPTQHRNVNVYYSSVPLDPRKTVAAVTLPKVSSAPAVNVTSLHVFAMSIGS